MDVRDWRRFAPCRRHEDPDIWFPDGATSIRDLERAAEAKFWCGVCPVLIECEAFVMALEGSKSASARFGIWAGLTPEERAARVRVEQRARRNAGVS